MEYVDIVVSDKRASTVEPKAVAVCGNTDYVARFTFDDEWSAYDTKTARFVTSDGYYDQIFTGNECSIPLFQDVAWVEIGVYAGSLTTTTRAYLRLEKSILCGGESQHPDPPEDIYNQIMDKLNEIPSPTVDDNGLVLGVVGGKYDLVEQSGGGGGGGSSVPIDNYTLIVKNGVMMVNTASAVEEDNTLPITAAAVNTTVGNIEVLLSTI